MQWASCFIKKYKRHIFRFSPKSLNTKNNLNLIDKKNWFLLLPSKRVPTSTSFLPSVTTLILFRHDLFQLNSAVIFCHPQISLICLIYPSLPNLYFYTIRSITVFLKVLNKVYFRVLTQT